MRTTLAAIVFVALPSSLFANELNSFDSIPPPDNNIKQRLLADAQELRPKFSHHTSRGAIYTLPIDNMPCLVSENIPKMPGQYNYRMPNMPNPFPRYRIKPEAGEK